jgi:hypothetical protein
VIASATAAMDTSSGGLPERVAVVSPEGIPEVVELSADRLDVLLGGP